MKIPRPRDVSACPEPQNLEVAELFEFFFSLPVSLLSLSVKPIATLSSCWTHVPASHTPFFTLSYLPLLMYWVWWTGWLRLFVYKICVCKYVVSKWWLCNIYLDSSNSQIYSYNWGHWLNDLRKRGIEYFCRVKFHLNHNSCWMKLLLLLSVFMLLSMLKLVQFFQNCKSYIISWNQRLMAYVNKSVYKFI